MLKQRHQRWQDLTTMKAKLGFKLSNIWQWKHCPQECSATLQATLQPWEGQRSSNPMLLGGLQFTHEKCSWQSHAMKKTSLVHSEVREAMLLWLFRCICAIDSSLKKNQKICSREAFKPAGGLDDWGEYVYTHIYEYIWQGRTQVQRVTTSRARGVCLKPIAKG